MFYKSKKRGFSLIETIVAVAVLALSVTGPLVVAEKGLTGAREAKNQMISSYLAQDALEFVKAVRNENIFRGRNWLVGLQNCASSDGSKKCTLDTVEKTSKTCPSASCDSRLRFEGWYSDNARYGYSSSLPEVTNFWREVYITSITGGEVKVSVVVKWVTPPFPQKSFTVESNMTNWD
ncbi:MAG: prepilin-type N-terminal cleavage/methylation domain-containing protein [bacterium]|nr:prepilin-type N-terminal cleavage/methylation domain-containing protein [bacterium]